MRLAAAVIPDKANAEDTNSRLFILRSVIFMDMGVFLSIRSANILSTSGGGREAPGAGASAVVGGI
jgi:hypothetical protein